MRIKSSSLGSLSFTVLLGRKADLFTVSRAPLNRSAQKSQRPKISSARKSQAPKKGGTLRSPRFCGAPRRTASLSFAVLLGPSGPIWQLATARVMVRSARFGHCAHEARRTAVCQSARFGAEGAPCLVHGTHSGIRAHRALRAFRPDLGCLGTACCLGAKRKKSPRQKKRGRPVPNSHSKQRGTSASLPLCVAVRQSYRYPMGHEDWWQYAQ